MSLDPMESIEGVVSAICSAYDLDFNKTVADLWWSHVSDSDTEIIGTPFDVDLDMIGEIPLDSKDRRSFLILLAMECLREVYHT
jgi:hypothetical protein